MSALYTDITNDRQFTQLAYEVGFYPWSKMRENAKKLIAYQRTEWLTKWKLLQRINEDRTLLDDSFFIRWNYNNIPTKTEWDNWAHNTILIVQYRISPAIPVNGGRIALISYATQVHDSFIVPKEITEGK